MKNSLSRLVQVLVAPRQAFVEIARRPTWAVALVALMLAGAASVTVVLARSDFASLLLEAAQSQPRAGTEGPTLDPALLEMLGWVMALFMAVIGTPAAYLLVALVFRTSFRLTGVDLPYRSSLAVTVHGLMPWFVQAILTIAVVFPHERLSIDKIQSGTVVVSSLAVFAPHGASPAQIALLGSLDLFSLWSLALLVLGFSVVGSVQRWQSARVVLTVWALYVLAKAGWALLG